MDRDDKPIGRILSRRDALKVLGIGSAALLVSCTSSEATSTAVLPTSPGSTRAPALTSVVLSCVVRPELTVGPYFVDKQLNRSDLRSEPSDSSVKEGIPLTLAIMVYDVSQNSCDPVEGAQVDIWHCDAQGYYSGVSDPGFDRSGQKFLRGYQLTDAAGKVQFTTIYPGWYSGRAVHIHFKIRTTGRDAQPYEFTSQFFFNEGLTDQVHAQEPYASKGQRDTLNAADNIYASRGDQLLLDVTGDNLNGYAASFDMGLDLADTQVGAADGFNGPGGGPPP